MPTAELTTSVTIAGVTVTGKASRSASQVIGDESAALPAAKTGTLTGRTDNDTGIATLAGGHGIISTDVVDVFWATGRRYGMTATVNVNAVTVDGGAGDNLPAQDTPVTVSKQVTLNIDFNGDNLKLFACYGTRRVSVVWQQEGGTVVLAKDLPANEAFAWVYGSGTTNPFAGNTVGKVKVSNGDSAGTAVLYQNALYDSAA